MDLQHSYKLQTIGNIYLYQDNKVHSSVSERDCGSKETVEDVGLMLTHTIKERLEKNLDEDTELECEPYIGIHRHCNR